MIKYNREAKPNSAVFGKHLSSEKISCENDDFYGDVTNYDTAEYLLENGWEGGFKRIIKELGKITVKYPEMGNKPEQFYGVEGFSPCVPKYLLGVPENMFNTKMVRIKKKIVNIFCSCNESWFVSAEDIIRRGTYICNFIYEVERMGFRVNLYSGSGSSEGDEQFLVFVKIKDSREYLSLKKIVFPIANPSMLRRIYFKTKETMCDCTPEWADGYGHPDPSVFKVFVNEHFDNGMIFPSTHIASSNERVTPKEYMDIVYTYNENFKLW